MNLLTKHQANKLDTDVRVWNLVDCSKDKFANVTAILDANGRLGTIIDAIRSKSSMKLNAAKGTATAKHAEEDKLATAIKKVAGSLNSLAIKEGDPITKEKVSVTRHQLIRMRPEDLMEKGNTIYDLGTARLADLTTNGTGTTAETLTELKAELDSFEKAVAAQGTGIGQQTTATQSIPELFRQADVIIYDEMDDLMEHVEETYPDLYAEFHEAKQINDRGTRHTPPPPPNPPAKG